MSYFTVEQLIGLSFGSKLSYVLPSSVKTLLLELESFLEITDTNATETVERRPHVNADRDVKRHFSASDSAPSFRHKNRYEFDAPKDRTKKRDFKQKEMGSSLSATDETEWEMMRSFKATKIESKTGIEKIVNDVRITLNKMSANNYEKQRDIILGLVNGYFAEEDRAISGVPEGVGGGKFSGETTQGVANENAITESNTCRISKVIFDIASTNKFYSEIYAKLYTELVEAHAVFRDLLEEFVNGFTSMEPVPVYVDPDVDYDGFCVYSKACEVRKSTSTFLVNCLKMELIDKSRISDILCEFLKYVDVKRAEEGVSKCVEEIVENIYIIATLCCEELSKTAKWREYVVPTIKRIISEKTNGLPGMSNRANFKLMDLLEKI